MDDKLTVGRKPKCTAPNSSEREAVSSYETAQDNANSVAKLCALSAHTLHKAGEVLTEREANKQTGTLALQPKVALRRKPSICLLTTIVPHTKAYVTTIADAKPCLRA